MPRAGPRSSPSSRKRLAARCDSGGARRLRFRRLKLSGFKSFVEPAELRDRAGPDRGRRPQRLRQVQPARGDPLGDGRGQPQVDARRRDGRRHLRRHRDPPGARLRRSVAAGRARQRRGRRRAARPRSRGGSSAAPARPIASTAATSAPRTSPCCSPTPPPARIARRWSARAGSARSSPPSRPSGG